MAVKTLSASRRDRRISIERFTETGRNSLNEPIMQWAEFAKLWAAVYFGTGAEQRAAAQTEATQAATSRCWPVASRGRSS
jgi:head-tail adaptor